MELTTFCLRLFVALIAGAIVGFERQWQQKKAGLRTNTLVAVGAAIYVLLSIQMTEAGGDPTRIIGQVVTGIGFLGAGVIMKHDMDIQGLTTAATIWCSSAVGCLAGAGYLVQCLILTATIIIINLGFRKVDAWLKRRKAS